MKDGPPSELHRPVCLAKHLFARPTLLQYGIGILSFLLLGVSCYSVITIATPAHANVSLQQISGKVIAKRPPADAGASADAGARRAAPKGRAVRQADDRRGDGAADAHGHASSTTTPTNTPSPTVTNTPSPTSTSTRTPHSSPTTTPPSPTAFVGQTTTPGPTPASSATATAVIRPGTGQNQTPGTTPAPSNNENRQSGPPADNGFPYMYIVVGLSGIAIVGFLFIPGWFFLRKHLLPMPAKRLPPSGAAPWKRTRTDDLQQSEEGRATNLPPPKT